MDTTKRPVNAHKAYHAHVYFSSETKATAKSLYGQIGEAFNLELGSLVERPVGPHPCWSYQILFGEKDFDAFIPWLDENREGLTVLVHGQTGDNLKDHTDYAYWLGQEAELELDMFR